ncbi:hypothetical protein AB0G02_09420 [Actinosynnema sp. NPDC023658]|uniref:hypothetical protein n=1 Tax=Actinosynnema sp. NPDC023658 TaxID=3155465 RepID=UPI0033F0ED3B
MNTNGEVPVSWWECEPRRLARDQREVAELFPELTWCGEGAGRWEGRLPRWPFHRPEPTGLAELVGQDGMPIRVQYGHAYPMVPPAIFPLDPEPELIEYRQTRFHVMGDGSLCLLQDYSTWTGRQSVTELLLKAAGWRVEYALLKSGVVESMTINGIVNDASRDHLVGQALEQLSAGGGQA